MVVFLYLLLLHLCGWNFRYSAIRVRPVSCSPVRKRERCWSGNRWGEVHCSRSFFFYYQTNQSATAFSSSPTHPSFPLYCTVCLVHTFDSVPVQCLPADTHSCASSWRTTPPASVFRHPASQFGTVAFRYRTGVHYSGTGQSDIWQNRTKVRGGTEGSSVEL